MRQVDDYRKNVISLILTPYFINIRKFSYERALAAIKEWSNKCNAVNRLDYKLRNITKYAVQSAMKNGYKPLSLQNLRIRNNTLYNILKHN